MTNQINAIKKLKIPAVVIIFIGKYEKLNSESYTNLIFLDSVHLDFPISF